MSVALLWLRDWDAQCLCGFTEVALEKFRKVFLWPGAFCLSSSSFGSSVLSFLNVKMVDLLGFLFAIFSFNEAKRIICVIVQMHSMCLEL